MKKSLLPAVLVLLSLISAHAQCVYTCTNYAVSPITYTTFPSGTLNITPSFTNPFGTSSAQHQDDGDVSGIPIGFNFDFYCSTYNQVNICSNGFISFVPIVWSGAFVHATQYIWNSGAPNGMIAYNMTDLNPGTGGSVTYTTVGTSPNRMFIVTYSNVPCFTTASDLNTGQIVLYETSNIIEIHTTSAFSDSNQGTSGSTQGIENASGSDGEPVPGRNQNAAWTSTAALTAFRFSPYSAAPLGPVSGNTLYCQGDVGSFSVQGTTGALSYSWFPPSPWTGASGSLTGASYTLGASGVVSVTANYTCGASPASTLQVSVTPAPVVSINSVSPAIICSGNTVAIVVSGASQYTLNPGNMTGTGTMTDMPATSTQYTLVGVDSQGCRSFNTANASVLVLESPTVTVNSGTMCLGKTFTMSPSGANQYQFSSIFSQHTPTLAGEYSYTVTGTATNGCVSDPAISSLTVYALPTTSVTANRLVMCAKESITLTATGASSYSWTHTSSTSNTLAVTLTVSTTFSVTGTTPEGCTRNSKLFITVNPCTDIEETKQQSAFRVYPNPSNGNFRIESGLKESVSVFDLIGREVHRQTVEEGTTELRLSHLASGKYILKGQVSGAQHVFVIVQD